MEFGKITDFTAKNGHNFKIGKDLWRIVSPEKSWSIQKIDDRRFRMETRFGDRWEGDAALNHAVQRAEVRLEKKVDKTKLVDMHYEFMVQTLNTANWFVVGQWHAVDDEGEGTLPCVSMQIASDRKLYAVCRSGEYPSTPNVAAWRTSVPITLNRWYKVEMKLRMLRNKKKGLARIWVDNDKVIDYDGPLGYDTDNFWKHGVYKTDVRETTIAQFKNFGIDISN